MQLSTLLVAALVLMPAATQTRPDLSGRWTTEPVAAAQGQRGAAPARPDLGSGWGTTLTLTQDPRQLTVEYAFFTRGDMQPPLKFLYALDGSEARNGVRMGRGVQEERSTAAWDGQALVITTAHDFKDPGGKAGTIEVVRRLSLESPDSLVVETTRGGALGGPPSTTRVVYRRLTAAR